MTNTITATTPKLSSKNFETIFVVLCVATISGFFFSRALVTIGSVLLGGLSVCQFGWKAAFRNYWTTHFNKVALLLLLISAISVFWSDDFNSWQKDIVTKLSLFIIPFGMSITLINKNKVLKGVLCALNILILSTVLNSLRIYFKDPEHAQDQYMLTTTLYGDHIRFSFMIALNILLNFYLYFEYKSRLKLAEQIFIWCSILIPFAYLHVLSARTGLLCAYIGLSLILIIKAWYYKKAVAFVVVMGILALPLIAIQLSPRLNDKVQFMIYEATHVKDKTPSEQFNYTDNNRILSYNVALKIIADNKLMGVGSGDLRSTMKAVYGEMYPGIPEKGKLEVPHMQFLSTAVAIGIPFALICILGLIVAPLIQPNVDKLYLGINMLMMFVYFLVDAHLEIQFGLLLFLFYTSFWLLLANKKVPHDH